ncbi:MAG: ABC transporter permease [Firmicutes bacterium]|nr:ABC transporter permease [Bacillota bacterium]
MKNQFKGFSNVFSFTFKQHIKSKGYKNSTILIALLCLILPAAIMTGVESFGSGAGEDKAQYEQNETPAAVDFTEIKEIYTVDISDDKKADLAQLPQILEAVGISVEINDYKDNFEKAQNDVTGEKNTVLLVIDQQGTDYTINILLPERSDVSEDTADGFDSIMMYVADNLSIANGGEAQYYTQQNDEDVEDPAESLKQVVMMVLTFANLMLIYFFVLAYGQGVANSVVTEKSSKLMESMLVAVKPTAIIMGKLLAITLTGIIQLFSWIFAIAISFFAGSKIVLSINPDSDMAILQVFRMIGDMTEGMFSPFNCLMAILLVMTGMLLYCSLAGMGGAMASKAEDLSSANAIFTLVLVVSFLVSIYAGGVMDGSAAVSVLDWIPFTAVLVTPSKIMMGMLTWWQTLGSLAVTVTVTVIATIIAGKVYKSLVLYKGEPLKLKKLIKMIRG